MSHDFDTRRASCRKCGISQAWARQKSIVCASLAEMVAARDILFRAAMPACECGAAKAMGVKDYAAGHSSWCMVAAR